MVAIPNNMHNLQHGHTWAGGCSPTYRSWVGMKTRCRSREEYSHVNYDPRWDKFVNFLEDMGERPEGKTIDRIDNREGYHRENCRWATYQEQTQNRGIAIFAILDGERLPLVEIAERIGTTWRALHHRHAAGTLQSYLDAGVFGKLTKREISINGRTISLVNAAIETGLHHSTLCRWYNDGSIYSKLEEMNTNV